MIAINDKRLQGKNKNSWFNYLHGFQDDTSGEGRPNIQIPDAILNVNSFSHSLFNHAIPWIYLLDYTTGQYLMTSNGVKFLIGYEPRYFTDGAIDAVLQVYDKKHLQLFNEEIFPDRLQLLKSIPPSQHPNYIFNYNLKLKCKNGESVNLLQRNCFIKSDDNGNPLLSYGIITNIQHYKEENSVIQVVEKINDAEILSGTSVVMKRHYYFNGEDRIFTKREKELFLWLTDGLSSKEIANKLFISEHTVINHKRNMMKKCNANNTAELVSFGIRNHLY